MFKAIRKKREALGISEEEIEEEQAKASTMVEDLKKRNLFKDQDTEHLHKTPFGYMTLAGGPEHVQKCMDEAWPLLVEQSVEVQKKPSGTQDQSNVPASTNFQLFTGWNSSYMANSNMSNDQVEALFLLPTAREWKPVLAAHAEHHSGPERDELAINSFVDSLTRCELAGAREDLLFVGYVPHLYTGSDRPKMAKIWKVLEPVFKWMASQYSSMEEVPEEIQFIFKFATNITFTISQ